MILFGIFQFLEPELLSEINSEMKFISKLPKTMTLLLRMLQMNDEQQSDEMRMDDDLQHFKSTTASKIILKIYSKYCYFAY